ncbi:unnamed protein product [Urochloa humidicola]
MGVPALTAAALRNDEAAAGAGRRRRRSRPPVGGAVSDRPPSCGSILFPSSSRIERRQLWSLSQGTAGFFPVRVDRSATARIDGAATTADRASVLNLQAPVRVELIDLQAPPPSSSPFPLGAARFAHRPPFPPLCQRRRLLPHLWWQHRWRRAQGSAAAARSGAAQGNGGDSCVGWAAGARKRGGCRIRWCIDLSPSQPGPPPPCGSSASGTTRSARERNHAGWRHTR